MKREIVKFSVDTELDLVLANKRAIKLAETVGLTKSEQTRFATAMSEISRNCIEYAKDCSITLSVQKITVNFLLVAEINDKGNGIKDLEGIFSGKFVRKRTKGLGIKNARMLVDDFAIVSDNEGTMVSLGLRFKPSVTITDELLNQWSNMFNNELPISPYDEIKKRNLDLVILSEQLKKSEENYSILTDTVPDLIWSTDASGMLLFANKWFHEYTGKDIHTFMFEFLLHPDEVEFHLNQQLAYIQMGKPYQFECRLRKANSSKFIWHLFKSVPVKNENKEIEKWVNVCTDIEAQKKIEEAYRDNEFLKNSERKLKENQILLEDKIQELNKINYDLLQFAYVSSHDLQEPLRKITSFGVKLQEDFGHALGETGKNYLDKVITSSNRLKLLIEHLFSFSKIERNQNKFVKTNLKQVVKYVIHELGAVIKEKNAKIKVEGDSEIFADPTQMKELFKQLLLNSMQHAKPAVAPKVLIAFREFQNNSQHGKGSRKFCEITLSDNGIGFLPEFSEKIFRMFQKLNPSDNKAGAGLAICKKIVDKHKGSIEAHGVLGKGAIFTINLPLEN